MLLATGIVITGNQESPNLARRDEVRDSDRIIDQPTTTASRPFNLLPTSAESSRNHPSHHQIPTVLPLALRIRCRGSAQIGQDPRPLWPSKWSSSLPSSLIRTWSSKVKHISRRFKLNPFPNSSRLRRFCISAMHFATRGELHAPWVTLQSWMGFY
jgi:hypothetical protein